jgi:CheY-like chemotaxis protein
MKRESDVRGRCILVLHDMQETREALESLLRSDGYLVYGATDEDAAIDRARWHRPHLILSSIGRSPQQVFLQAERIRNEAGLCQRTPMVVLSVPTVPEGSEVHIGYNIYITLPDNFDQLRALLKRLLENVSDVC